MKKRISAFVLCLMFSFGFLGMCIPAVSGATSQASSNEKLYQRVSNGTIVTTVFESIPYDDIEIETYVHIPALPSYTSGISCGVTSTGVTIAYFQKELPDLIPNHVAGRKIGNTWVWTGQNATINGLFTQLDTIMNGNGALGVTIQEYLGGLGYYATYLQGFQTFVSEVRIGDNAVSNSFKTQIQSGKLVALFLDGYNITGSSGVEHFNGYDNVALTEYAEAHIMTAFGYKEVKYKDENGDVFREDLYARVHTGICGMGWIRLSTNCTIDSATVTYIYE